MLQFSLPRADFEKSREALKENGVVLTGDVGEYQIPEGQDGAGLHFAFQYKEPQLQVVVSGGNFITRKVAEGRLKSSFGKSS
jgi:hypothetical protein